MTVRSSPRWWRAAAPPGTAAFVVAVFMACTATTTRPPFAPFPEAYVDTLNAAPDAIIREITAGLRIEGVGLHQVSVRDGYVETDGYDVVTGTPTGFDRTRPKRIVVLRFWADPSVQDRTTLTAEVVHRVTADPSLPSRLTERMVPPDHSGDEILQRILDHVRGAVGETGTP